METGSIIRSIDLNVAPSNIVTVISCINRNKPSFVSSLASAYSFGNYRKTTGMDREPTFYINSVGTPLKHHVLRTPMV